MSEVVKVIFDSRDLLLGHSFADMCRAKLRTMDFDSSTRFELYGDHGHMILPLPRESVAIFGAVALDIICCRGAELAEKRRRDQRDDLICQ